MSVVRTIERILREPEDASGQTVRSWRLCREGDFITIARSEHSDWLSVRAEDIRQFIADLYEVSGLTGEAPADGASTRHSETVDAVPRSPKGEAKGYPQPIPPKAD